MKYIKLFLLFFIILFSEFVFCQSTICEQLQIQKKDVDKLNKRLLEVLSKDTIITAPEDYEFFHVYWFGLIDSFSIIAPEDFRSGEFIKKVTTGFYPYNKNFLKKDKVLRTSNSIMINKNNRRLIASGNSQIFTRYFNHSILKEDNEFIALTKEKDFILFFLLSWGEPIFALTKEGELWVIRKNSEKKFEINTLEYFLEHDYDTWGWWNM